MAFDNRARLEPRDLPINDTIDNSKASVRIGDYESPSILQLNPNIKDGKRDRQLIIWRVPQLGFVPMYINPQQMRLQEKKVIQKQRTKGGYVIQYWGEELPIITLEGSTGASGIEGINILRKVYRAEQNAFQQVSQTLADRLQSFTVGGTLANLIGAGAEQNTGNAIAQVGASLFGGSANPPLLPTLGSLAVSVELFHQGWVFKGYFNEFSITESVTQGVGVFNYSMTFTVLDRRGTRTNFMPWHRSPATLDSESENPLAYFKSNADSTPPSFGGEE